MQLKGFIKGQIEGMHYVKPIRKEVLKILRKYLQITTTKPSKEPYEFFANALSRSPRTELEGIKTSWRRSAPVKEIAEFVDMNLIDEIERKASCRNCTGIEELGGWSDGVLECLGLEPITPSLQHSITPAQ